jgi:hypothetical protein
MAEIKIKFETVKVKKPEDVNVIIGQAHFIKTVEDLYEAMVAAVPGIRFGIAFCESSGKCLIRAAANEPELKELAIKNAQTIAAGHVFVIVLKQGYPINVLNAVKQVAEVCTVYCATANPVELIIGVTSQGRGVLGVIDGSAPKGVEDEDDVKERRKLLRKIGYKL